MRKVRVTVIDVSATVIEVTATVILLCGKGRFAVVWRGAYM
ncbi:MAG: hypothetical protein R3C08_06425 [Hyphomonas sp.]